MLPDESKYIHFECTVACGDEGSYRLLSITPFSHNVKRSYTMMEIIGIVGAMVADINSIDMIHING